MRFIAMKLSELGERFRASLLWSQEERFGASLLWSQKERFGPSLFSELIKKEQLIVIFILVLASFRSYGSISDPAKFRSQSMSYNLHFSKKRLCPRKNFQCGEIFKIDIFVLKYVLEHSKSIPTKSIFREIFDFSVIFCAKKLLFRKFWAQNNCFRKKLTKIFEIILWIFKPSYIHVTLPIEACSPNNL